MPLIARPLQKPCGRAPTGRASGTTLIEVLISVFVLSIGLLGAASMLANSLKFNQSSYLRTQATILSTDIVDRMRANDSQLASYVVAIGAAPTATACTSCSPAQLASIDIADWKASLADDLPEGDGSITSTGSDVYAITVQWKDRDDNVRSLVMEAQL